MLDAPSRWADTDLDSLKNLNVLQLQPTNVVIYKQEESLPPEPPDANPALITSLWENVALKHSRVMASLPYLPTRGCVTQGFSNFFHKLLGQYQISIKVDKDVPAEDRYTNLWTKLCDAIPQGSAEEAAQPASCRVWEDNVARAVELAAWLKKVFSGCDSSHIVRRRFIIDQILHGCGSPGARVYNYPLMLKANTEPYYLLPMRESTTSSVSKQSAIKKSAVHSTNHLSKPTLSSAKSNISSIAHSRSCFKSSIQPMSISQPTIELKLPTDDWDCADWVDDSYLKNSPRSIAHLTFVSNGTPRKTSPYLSISFEKSDCPSPEEQRLSAKNRIAIYGSTALYNRRLLHIQASQIKCDKEVKRSACDFHFGMAVTNEETTIYVFQCREDKDKNGGQDSAISWHGCSMSKVGEWELTDPTELAHMLDGVRGVTDWVRRVYVPELQADPVQLLGRTHG